jgi:hypothetical protein
MFSDQTRERLRLGKYTRWAANLSEAQVEALLWMIGEFGSRASHVLPLLGGLWGSEGSGRSVLALESLFRAVGGDRPDVEDYKARVRAFLAEARGHADEAGGPPGHAWPLIWQGRSVGHLVAPVLEEFGCSCSGTWLPDGDGATDFATTVRASQSEGVEVTVGGIRGLTKSLPDEVGRMAFWLIGNINQ